MRVEVAREKRGLEKQQARRPDLRRAAEPGQNRLGDQGLDLEKKEGTAEDGQRGQQPAGSSARHLARLVTWVHAVPKSLLQSAILTENCAPLSSPQPSAPVQTRDQV